MKKVFALAALALFAVSFSACGPSEEQEKKEKEDVSKDMRSDEQRMIDSINAAMMPTDTTKK